MVLGDISLCWSVSADLGVLLRTHADDLLQRDSVIHGQEEDVIGELTSLVKMVRREKKRIDRRGSLSSYL